MGDVCLWQRLQKYTPLKPITYTEAIVAAQHTLFTSVTCECCGLRAESLQPVCRGVYAVATHTQPNASSVLQRAKIRFARRDNNDTAPS